MLDARHMHDDVSQDGMVDVRLPGSSEMMTFDLSPYRSISYVPRPGS
jgi:hypothetical protein